MRKAYSQPMVRKLENRPEELLGLKARTHGAERRRSTRIAIQIPVQIFFRAPAGEELRVEAFTIAVNLEGCLLAMDMKPEVGQAMWLRNAQADGVQAGHVVRAEWEDGSAVVAVEFDSPDPRFWPIPWPPKDWLVATS